MPVELTSECAVFSGVVGIDDAEAVLSWALKEPLATIDFSACTHLHSATLQVLMARKPGVKAWPADGDFAAWLKSVLVDI